MLDDMFTASVAPRLQFRVKKEGWGGGGTRNVTFVRGQGDVAALKAGGKTLTVSIGDGLPRNASECQGTGGWQRGDTRALGSQGTAGGLGASGWAGCTLWGLCLTREGAISALGMGQHGELWGTEYKWGLALRTVT